VTMGVITMALVVMTVSMLIRCMVCGRGTSGGGGFISSPGRSGCCQPQQGREDGH